MSGGPGAAGQRVGRTWVARPGMGSGRGTTLRRVTGPRRPGPPMVPRQAPHQEEAAMSVTRFEPFRDPFREFDRLLSMAAAGTRAPLGMPMDVYRAQDRSYHVEADLPGADPDTVEVTVEHAVLTIRAERTPHYGGSEQVLVAERPQGSFARQLSLGEGVDSDNLPPGYAADVLPGTSPAPPKAQAPRLEVTRAAAGSP